MNRVLIHEPDAVLGASCKEYLEKRNLWVLLVSDPVAARELLRKQLFHLCVWPVRDLPEASSLHAVRQLRPGTGIIATSARTEPGLIVACIRSGASNYWCTSGSLESFGEIVTETLSRVVPDSIGDDPLELPFPHFIGKHPKMLEIFQIMHRVKNVDSTVLITGESGTGKEVVASALHYTSPRRRLPWVAVNCSAIPASLLESELFGHVRGAFTGATQNRLGRFQVAGQGTLFLDEISELSFDLQAKILRAIQNRQFEPVGNAHSINLEARIIAATNQDLESAVIERRFREDLYYRLNVIQIYVPPLRARKTDIPLLVRSFLEKFCRLNSKDFAGISEEAMQALMDYHWPGNIRELENMMERVVVLKREEGIVELKDLPVNHFKNVRLDRFVANVALPESGIDFNEAVNEFENELILQALQKTAGNKNKAASLLNLNRTTLVEKLKRKGLRIAS